MTDSQRLTLLLPYVKEVVRKISANKTNAHIAPPAATRVEVERAACADITAALNTLARSPDFKVHKTINGNSISPQ